jgi:hypothetical protein
LIAKETENGSLTSTSEEEETQDYQEKAQKVAYEKQNTDYY